MLARLIKHVQLALLMQFLHKTNQIILYWCCNTYILIFHINKTLICLFFIQMMITLIKASLKQYMQLYYIIDGRNFFLFLFSH